MDTETNVNETWKKVEDEVRAEPWRSVAIALGSGFLLSFFPITWFLGVLVRLLLKLIKPALLVFGVMKILDYARNTPDLHSQP
ncbi:MAG: hypothetical protein JO076_05050 [Verrucomicrobia bacterium]|nr:hypothetical protein [Verrucomicrobiota bacterium]